MKYTFRQEVSGFGHQGRSFFVRSRKFMLLVLSFLLPLALSITYNPRPAAACCWLCGSSDCNSAEQFVEQRHQDIYDETTENFDEDLQAFQEWMIDHFLYEQVVPALAMMVNQMNAVAMQYTQAIGGFLDAKNQIETQRLQQQLKLQAHRDYHPSDDFCWFGTNVRSMAGSDSRAKLNRAAMSKHALERWLGYRQRSGADSPEQDLKSRWNRFTRVYCDTRDNNRIRAGISVTETGNTGLQLACDHDGPGGSAASGGDDAERLNKDIDYTRLIDEPRTIEIDFSDASLATGGVMGSMAAIVGAEEDVLEMSKNLYGHYVPSRDLNERFLGRSDAARRLYMSLRSVTAKRSVAQHSFNAIVSLKSRGTSSFGPLSGDMLASIGASGVPIGGTIAGYTLFPSQAYLAAVMRELLPVNDMNTNTNTSCDTGADPSAAPVNNACIYALIGLQPSYYAQLEILAKKIYQNPDFYANLYESVANVDRKRVAMQAIELMVDREIYESQIRKEMIVSVLLSTRLNSAFKRVEGDFSKSSQKK